MPTLREEDDDNGTSSEAENVEVQNEARAEAPEVEVVEDDTRLSNDEGNDEEEEAPRQRVKETAAERRARAKKAKENDKRELEFQRREMARLEKHIQDLSYGQTVSRVTELDSRIATANSEFDQMQRVKAAAIDAKKGSDVVMAENLMEQARQKAWQAHQEREQLVKQANTPRQVAPPYVDKAQKFIRDNPWYNHGGTDADSQLVKEIDDAVAKEYIPTSDAYWNELQRRVAKNLPHHFESNQEETVEEEAPRTRRGPPVGGSTRSNSSTSTTQIRLSPERVQAMKEAGLWDDPKVRTKMAKRYAEHDKNQRG